MYAARSYMTVHNYRILILVERCVLRMNDIFIWCIKHEDLEWIMFPCRYVFQSSNLSNDTVSLSFHDCASSDDYRNRQLTAVVNN